MTEDQPLFFLKFGSEKNMTDLIKNGTIFFNTIDYFQRLEEQGLRGDNYEGTTKITNYHKSNNLKLTITNPETGQEIPIRPTRLHLREFLKDIKGNLFSLYCLRPKDIIDNSNFRIDPRVKDFGTHFVLINNVGKFMDQVCEELEKNRFYYRSKQVEYYEKNNVNGELSLFHKSNEFEYQNEFRIVLENYDIEPKIIQIGNIEEYAGIYPSSAIDTMHIKWEP